MEKFLLNPKQAATFTVFLTGTSSQIDVRGRLVDGQIVKYVELNGLPVWVGWLLGVVILMVSLLPVIGMGYTVYIVTNQAFLAFVLGIAVFTGVGITFNVGVGKLLARYGWKW
jgi:hypothetical protein